MYLIVHKRTCHYLSILQFDNRWIRDHWHRQYNGKVRCCCGWFEGGPQPLYGRRIANRCDYRRLVTSTENVNNCRDANEGHNMGFDDIGCDRQYESSQLNKPIPEDNNVCWEIEKFGFTEEGEFMFCFHIALSSMSLSMLTLR